MTKLRFGIVGCGNIASTHAQALAGVAEAELVAVCDELPDRAERVASEFGVPALPLDALWNEVDAVAILLPSGLHAPMAIEAARRGKHVLTEKPLDIAVEPAEAMVRACEEAGVALGCVSQHRFAPDVIRLRDLVAGGEIGRPLLADAAVKWSRSPGYYASAGWRGTWAMDGGGCLMNQGVHTVDLIQWIMGGVKAVQARTYTMRHAIEVEDVALALVEYANGAVGTIRASTAAYPGFGERIEIHGERGSAILESDRLRSLTVRDPAEQEAFGGRENPVEGEAPPGFPELHRRQIEAFARAVLAGEEPSPSGRDGLAALKVVLAIYESARHGGERVEP